MHQAIYDKLQAVARAQDVTYYADIAPLADLDMNSPADRNRMSELLAEIAVSEHEQKRPLLTAVVIHHADNQPGQGFFDLARELGLFRAGKPYIYFVNELRRVHDHWRPHETPGNG